MAVRVYELSTARDIGPLHCLVETHSRDVINCGGLEAFGFAAITWH